MSTRGPVKPAAPNLSNQVSHVNPCVAMTDPFSDPDCTRCRDIPSLEPNSRITVEEIARRLGVGRQTVYKMLKQRSLPGIRVGRLWIITRHAYETWERTCGMRGGSGLEREPEVMVLN